MGAIFKTTTAGTLTTLHSSGADGLYPTGLIQATDGNFYGTTGGGGAYGYGTVFKITVAGTLATLYSFLNLTDGANPYSGLIQATNGTFYGATGTPASGEANAFGTIFLWR